jgi:hypothetical protein
MKEKYSLISRDFILVARRLKHFFVLMSKYSHDLYLRESEHGFAGLSIDYLLGSGRCISAD